MVSEISRRTSSNDIKTIVATIRQPEVRSSSRSEATTSSASSSLAAAAFIGLKKAPTDVASVAGSCWRHSQLERRRGRRQLGLVVAGSDVVGAALAASGDDATGARPASANCKRLPAEGETGSSNLAEAKKPKPTSGRQLLTGERRTKLAETRTTPRTTKTTTRSRSSRIESRISSSRRVGAGLALVGGSLQHLSPFSRQKKSRSKSRSIAKSWEPAEHELGRSSSNDRPLGSGGESSRRPFTPLEPRAGKRRPKRPNRNERQAAAEGTFIEEKSKATTGKLGGRSLKTGHDLIWRSLPAWMLALAFTLAACCLSGASCSATKWQQITPTTRGGGQRQQQQQVVVGASGQRVLRQISPPTFWRSSSELPLAAAQHSAGQPQQSVPYKTFYVTRACEWKSNLFVPKSNDIHFAQSSSPSSSAAAAGEQQQANSQPESSVVYETFNTNANNNNNNYQNSRTGAFGQPSFSQQPVQLEFQQQQDGSRTMLSTDSKALILALPLVMSQSFAGYEPACSIRLIVPRNMRILAKLTSRRLTFAQQQLEGEQSALDGQPQVWLNVSQSEFSETEHKTIETVGNVLAFRFLLERFASKQAADTRFQVVLTAFQTLSENSDLSGAGGGLTQQQAPDGRFPQSGSSGRPPFQLDPNAQFICDQQRLISAELACDGFKNCQDGNDEELATCLALRHPELAGPNGNLDQNSIRNQLGAGSNGSDGTLASGGDDRAPIWVRVWHWARDTNSLAGFLLGFLLVLLLLTCCSCCSYLFYLAWRRVRRWRRHRQVEQRADQARELGEADSLAAQNIENAARWKRSLAEEERQRQLERRRRNQQQQSHQPGKQTRLQSILKKPSAAGSGLPLEFGARQSRPAEPPPAVPVRPTRANQQQQQQQQQYQQGPTIASPRQLSGESRAATPSSKRGALSSSLTQPTGGGDFKPTPAKRLTRPTRPVPVPGELQQQQASRAGSYSQRQVGEQRSSAVSKTMTTTSSTTGTQRVTSYHYSSGSTRYSESYLQRLAAEQQQHQQSSGGESRSTPSPQVAVTGVRPIAPTTPAPPSGTNVHYSKREPSPRSSLI